MDQESFRKATGSTAALLWFASLFVAAIAVATITLAASQLQSRLHALTSSDAPLSVWQIERIRSEWAVQLKRVEQQRNQVDELYTQMIRFQDRVESMRIEVASVTARLEQATSDLIYKIRLYEPLLVPEGFELKSEQELRAALSEIVAGLEQKVTQQNWNELTALNQTFIATLDAKLAIEQELNRAHAQAYDAQDDLERVEAMLDASRKALDRIIDPDGKLSAADQAKIHDLISEFSFIESFAFGTLHKFAVLPSDFLIIILVVAMGVLGSAMQLTYDYYRAANVPSASLFVLRPMLGAITALVVFILLRAGVLVIADVSEANGGAPSLNPFFIAFVGIVSGLLSENALDTVRRVGGSWLSGSGTDRDARWASGVKELLSDQKTTAGLAAITGLDEVLINEWVEQKRPAPADIQKLFAAWLDRDVRNLFTDIAPPAPA